GIATLRLIRDSDAIVQANRTAVAIRDGMNDAIRRLGASWCVYGEFSDFHVFCNPGREAVSPADIQSGKVHWTKLKGATPLELLPKVRPGFLLHGVDVIGWPGGLVSAVHTMQDVDRTVTAFEKLLRMLAEEGELGDS